MPQLTEQQVWDALREIPDPEIPTINLVDLGVIHRVRLNEKIRVEMLPTFIGCPAIDVMRRAIEARLAPHGAVEVAVVFDEVWTTERISSAGREMLKEAGLAPPPRGDLMKQPLEVEAAVCPYCGSPDTQMDNLFGPTPCRSIYYCRGCRHPFEQFKTV